MKLLLILGAVYIALHILLFWSTNKIKSIPKNYITAEMVIDEMNKTKIRPLEVEMLYNTVRYEFNRSIKSGRLDRDRILYIRKYLSQNVKGYTKKKFTNDAHAIYTMLKAADIKERDLVIVQKLLS